MSPFKEGGPAPENSAEKVIAWSAEEEGKRTFFRAYMLPNIIGTSPEPRFSDTDSQLHVEGETPEEFEKRKEEILDTYAQGIKDPHYKEIAAAEAAMEEHPSHKFVREDFVERFAPIIADDQYSQEYYRRLAAKNIEGETPEEFKERKRTLAQLHDSLVDAFRRQHIPSNKIKIKFEPNVKSEISTISDKELEARVAEIEGWQSEAAEHQAAMSKQ